MTDVFDPARLDAIRSRQVFDKAREMKKLCDVATPGPWKVWAMAVMADPVGNSDVDDCTRVAETFDAERGLKTFNAHFIAAARTALPELIDALLAYEPTPDASEATEGLARTLAHLAASKCTGGVPQGSDGTRYHSAKCDTLSKEFASAIARATAASEARVRKLEAAISWALGETDDFPERQPGQGAYWWRRELRKRSGGAR